MRELDLDRLKTLMTIADLGSFVAASRALHLAPPTVSLHVAELEARVGTPLLLRTRGRVAPTGAGATLVERARRLLADADDALDAVRRQVAGRAGRVRLGASTGAIAHLLPRALEAIGRSHPEVDVRVAVLTSEESMARLAAGTLDVGLVALPQPSRPGLRVRPWRRDPIVAFVPAAWPRPRHATPAWLAARPLILNDAGTRLSRQTAEWFAAAGLRPQARIELNYNDAIKSLVGAGYGAALLPHEATAPQPDPRIAILPVRPALWRPLGIACRAGAAEPAVAVVLAALQRVEKG
jgi:DNA-binding transcriptional LysR family regulator